MSFTLWKREVESAPHTAYANSIFPRIARLEYGWDAAEEWRHELDEKLQKIDERLEEIGRVGVETNKAMTETNKAVADCAGRVQILASKSQALERASGELGRLGENFYERHVLEPMVRSIFPLFDLLEEANGGEEGGALATALGSETVEFLAQYNIEPYRHKEGDEFDGKTMQPIKIVEAEEKDQDYKIKQSCKSGFKWGERVLRAEPVILYRFKEKEAEGGDSDTEEKGRES